MRPPCGRIPWIRGPLNLVRRFPLGLRPTWHTHEQRGVTSYPPTSVRRKTMSKLLMPIVVASTLPLAAPAVHAQTTANERNCPSSRTDASGKPMPEAIPPFVGTGSAPFSPNQSLCLPQLAPVPTGESPLAFIVQGVEPGDRVDAQGTAYRSEEHTSELQS